MLKNGFIRFSLLGAILIFLLTACSAPRYSHAGDRNKSSRYAKTSSTSKSKYKIRNTRKKKKSTKPSRSNTFVDKVDKLDLRLNVVASAEKFIGIKYVYGGKTPNPGFDCSGFTSWVMKENGITVNGASYTQSKLGKRIPKSKVAPGDLIFFGKNSKVSHVAIVKAHTGNKLEVIHSTSGSGVTVDEINHSEYWNKRYLYARQVIQ